MHCRIEREGETARVFLSGRCTFEGLAQFETILSLVREERVRALALDLHGLAHIDSSGIGMLLMLRDVCEKQQSGLVLKRVSAPVGRLLQLSRLERLFTIEEA
jgi:anti-anti-sigma factor